MDIGPVNNKKKKCKQSIQVDICFVLQNTQQPNKKSREYNIEKRRGNNKQILNFKWQIKLI